MSAVAAEEARMLVEHRIARLESDVTEIKTDLKVLDSRVTEIKGDLQAFKTDVAKEFGSVRAEIRDFKTEVAKEFGAVRAELRDFKTEVAQEFGCMRTEMKSSFESLATSIERTKVWMLTSGLATLLGVAAIVGLKSH
jgi:chromosome segregation ATPase